MPSSTSSFKSFVWSSVVFSLVGLGTFLGATELLIRDKVEPVHTTNAYIRLFRSPGDADVVFGASPAANGFTGQPGFINLAMEGDSIAGIANKVRLFYGQGHEPRRVIVELSAAHFSPTYARQLARHQEEAAADLIDGAGGWLRVFSPIYRNELIHFWSMWLDGKPFVPLATFLPDGARVLSGTVGMPSTGAILQEVTNQLPMPDFERSPANAVLVNLLDFLAGRKGRACVTIFPRLEQVLQLEGAMPRYREYRDYLTRLALERHIAVADMSDMAVPPENFANLYHLNKQGAVLVSAAIVERCFGRDAVTVRHGN